MPITEKECACGCGEKFHGTKRAKFYSGACRQRWNRKNNKAQYDMMIDKINGDK